MVPVLATPVLLAVALSLKEPFPVRFAGVTFETVNQDVALLVGIPQVVLEVTFIVVLPPPGGAFHEVGDKLRVACGC